MKGKLLSGVVLLLIASLIVSGCSSGISEEQLAAVELERDTAQEALAELQEICPVKYFESLTKLETWLAANPISEESTSTYADGWYRKALRLQQDAIEDGYLISAEYDYATDEDIIVWCTALIDGKVFYWDPEIDEVFEEFGFGTLQ